MNTPELTKDIARKLFEGWILQRPGLDLIDYGFSPEQWRYNPTENYRAIRSYRNEANKISLQRKEALKALNSAFADWKPFDAELLFKACNWAFSGRLQVKYDEKMGWYIDYCAGQYWPAEYRLAAYHVLDRYTDFIHQAQLADLPIGQ